MRFVSIELRDWRAYEHCRLEFPDGMIGVGGRNGAGKTTIAEAITWALFGKTRQAAKVSELRRRDAAGRASVDLVFQLEETLYRVRRVAQGEAMLWIGDIDGEPEAVGARNVTRRLVEELKLPWDVFRRSIFAEQKDVAALDQTATGAARRSHIERLLGLSQFKSAAEKARYDHHDALEDADGAVREAEQELAKLGYDPEAAATDHKALETVEADVARLTRERELLAAEVEGLEARRAALDRVNASGQPDAIETELKATRRRIRELEREKATTEAARAHAEEHLTLVEGQGPKTPCVICGKPYGDEYEGIVAGFRDELDRATAREAELAAELKATLDQSERVEERLVEAKEAARELGRTEGPASSAKAARSLAARRRRLEEVERRLEQAEERRGPLAERVEEAEGVAGDYGAKSAVLDERRKQLARAAKAAGVKGYSAADHQRVRRRAEKLGELAKEAEGLRAALAGVPGLVRRKAELEAELETEAESEAKAAAALAGLEFDPKHLVKAERECEAAEKARDELRERHQEAALEARGKSEAVRAVRTRLKAARKAHRELDKRREQLRRHEIAARLLDEFREHEATRAWPSLERGAGDLLNAATDGRYADVRLTEGDYKLSIVDRGEQFPLTRFSGGEQDLANLCLRLAIAEWVARERGVSIGVLILDEVFGSQDEDRRQGVLDQLRRLSARFRQTLIITHVPEVAESCDQRIDVEIDGDGKSTATLAS